VAERTADLSRANAELSRAVHLKDEFLATMSHELRTPLNAILGRAEALQEEVYGPLMPRQDTAVHAIRESGQHLLSLINDILDLSKIEAGQLELELQPVDVEQLCGASLHMVAQSAAVKHITLRSSLDALVVRVAADERRLRQILLNLLANAIKFTSVGGTVELELRGDAEHGRVTFAVTDTGIGIADEDLGKLFQPFVQIDSRLSRRYDGTGLGLALVRRMAEAHAGSVAVESVPGQGSRFSVTLPWSAAEAGIPAAPTPVAPALQPAGASDRQPRILLAEASPASSQMLLDLLAARDYAVSVVRTGGEALARVYEARPDAILLDIHMPELDGLDVIRRIRAAPGLGDVPIIALTALAIPGDRERCLAAGADDYLAKPVNLRTLLAALDAQRQ
jgi:CheY-like chemotaxis protein